MRLCTPEYNPSFVIIAILYFGSASDNFYVLNTPRVDRKKQWSLTRKKTPLDNGYYSTHAPGTRIPPSRMVKTGHFPTTPVKNNNTQATCVVRTQQKTPLYSLGKMKKKKNTVNARASPSITRNTRTREHNHGKEEENTHERNSLTVPTTKRE